MELYNIYDLFSLELQDNGLVPDLHRELAHLTTDTQLDRHIVLVWHRHAHSLSGDDSISSGIYKGIRWQLRCNRDDDGRVNEVHFCSRYFRKFLGVRLALIPLVREVAIESGGLALIGSAFRWRETTWHLYGKPGCGKTHLLLECLDDGAELIGDCELIIRADGTIHPLFDIVEFRYATIRQTASYELLSPAHRGKLQFCRLISFLTARRISFNLTLPPVQLEWMGAHDTADATHALVGLGVEPDNWDTDTAVAELLAYSMWYQSHYPVSFAADAQASKEALKENLQTYVQRCDLSAVPAGATLQALGQVSASRSSSSSTRKP